MIENMVSHQADLEVVTATLAQKADLAMVSAGVHVHVYEVHGMLNEDLAMVSAGSCI